MRHFCCSDPTGPGQATPRATTFKSAVPSTSSSSREGPRLAQSSGYQMGREVLLALRARHTLPGLAVHLCRSAHPSQVPNKIIWETAQLIFKLLQKQLLKTFPTKIKTLLSQKSPALQAAASKTQSTNFTGGHRFKGTFKYLQTRGDWLYKMPPILCPSTCQ